MTSEERRNGRFERRTAERAVKDHQKQLMCAFEKMFSYSEWIQAILTCQKNVGYKASVQEYLRHPLVNINRNINDIKNGKKPFKVNLCRISIKERGKERHIEPIFFEKRVGEHVFCDLIYLVYFIDSLIYDNGASLKGRGTDFARERVLCHLEKAKREYGTEFYVWQFDFKSFFDKIKYRVCEQILKAHFQDERIVDFSIDSITEYSKGNIEIAIKTNSDNVDALREKFENGDGEGICLGSQNSQITALIVPNELDHFIKDLKRIKYYCRYMDDGIIFHNDKEFLKELWKECEIICEKLGLTFNPKKTKIVKITKGFTFLKTNYQVTKDGKILRRPHRSGIVRNRRKLNRYYNLVKQGKMTLEDVYNSFQSYFNHTKKIGKSFKTRKEMLKQYRRLFGDYRLDELRKML